MAALSFELVSTVRCRGDYVFSPVNNCNRLMCTKHRHLIPLGFEPRTSRVLGERDNHYTMESDMVIWPVNLDNFVALNVHV